MNRQQTNVELIAALAEQLGEHLIAEHVRARFGGNASPAPASQDDPTWESPQEAIRRRRLEGKINKATGILNYHKVDLSCVPKVPDFAQVRSTPEGRDMYFKALETRLKSLEALAHSLELEAQNVTAKVIGLEP